MRPVVPEEVDDLLKSRQVMIFNRTLLGPAYIETLVSCSPRLITSKGGKRLPLEVWYMIIDFANRYPENHQYFLVLPKLLQTNAGGDELVCERFKRWLPFCDIKTLKGFEMFQFFLAHPDESDNPNLDPKRLRFFYHPYPSAIFSPFSSSISFPFSSFDSTCAFPAALLASKIKFLHVELTVPDVIKNVEDGKCDCCLRKHVIGTDFKGRQGNRWNTFWELLDGLSDWYMTGFFFCPLCVGPEHARESIDVHESTSLSREEYNSWLLDRLESLGFKRPRWEDVPYSLEKWLWSMQKLSEMAVEEDRRRWSDVAHERETGGE
ncbi:hypothetical protein FGADI_3401 [Fusarium gaditjirri]|uniref:Uncharacterized protein n=1 Tax=Fusarium gaditjirri TaxID=282569 RepID=A0A8H4X0X4_9HYPO|nr:hypothetical protein FGADI_3401 [Fusarium gaditjirri]